MVSNRIGLNAFCRSTIPQKQFIIIKNLEVCQSRSNRPEVFCEKYVLRNITKFTGKQPNLFFNKVAGLNCRPPSIKGMLQLTFTYSKSTIETLEKGVKHVQS